MQLCFFVSLSGTHSYKVDILVPERKKAIKRESLQLSSSALKKQIQEVQTMIAKQSSEHPLRLDTLLESGHSVGHFSFEAAKAFHSKRARKPRVSLMAQD